MGIIVTLLVMILTTIIGYWSLINGWGVAPKSWGIIITATVVNWFLTLLMMAVNAANKKS